MKSRRTLLWVNGNNEEKLKKAIASNADAVVLELEDLVPAPEKEAARAGAVKALREVDFKGKERIVRINHPDSDWGKADMEAIFPLIPDAIRLPKCETVDYVLRVDRLLAEAEERQGVARNTIELILMIETPLGVINGYQLATCCERITGMGLGAGDLTSAMGVDRDIDPDSEQLLYAKQKMVMDAKAAGIQVFDTTVITSDPDGASLNEFIAKDTMRDKVMGFTGRSVSMLPHIDIINRVFTPSKSEYELAVKIVNGYEEQMAQGISEIFVEGNFVDPPIRDKAQGVIDTVEMICRKEGKTIEEYYRQL